MCHKCFVYGEMKDHPELRTFWEWYFPIAIGWVVGMASAGALLYLMWRAALFLGAVTLIIAIIARGVQVIDQYRHHKQCKIV